MIGQMMEPVEFKQPSFPPLPPKDWATTAPRPQANVINSLYSIRWRERLNNVLAEKYEKMRREEVRFESTTPTSRTGSAGGLRHDRPHLQRPRLPSWPSKGCRGAAAADNAFPVPGR